MPIISWKTNSIGLGKPPKVIAGIAQSIINLDLWPYSYGTDDPYYSQGTNPKPYRFRITFNIANNAHGSHLTRIPYVYNAQDVEVGDFVAGADDGKVLQVVSIVSKTESALVAICEDRLRYNTYRSGNGSINVPGNVIFFQINENGLPMLDPLPGIVSSTFYPNVMSRFNYLNPLTNYLLEKTNHGFEVGDAICIENETFAKSNADNIIKFIGTVVDAGPGPNQFILRPANGIIDYVPALPGNVGDYIYPSVDGTGDLTTDSAGKRPVYMKIANAIETVTIGTGITPTGSDGDIVEINRVTVTLSGTGTYNLNQAVTLINAKTARHKVTASAVNGATAATSSIGNTSYGIVGGYVPFSATINGTTVSFSTTTSGAVLNGAGTADATDMATDINAANITNIVASVSPTGQLILTNVIGQSITIANVSGDTNSTPFAGSSSISGLPLTTSANTSTFVLRLAREDGGPMTIRDVQGSFFSTAAVTSGQNGRYALGLLIEQGLRNTTTSVVADIAARDALYSLIGDQAHVINSDDENGNYVNQWSLWLWTGTEWTLLSRQSSANIDSKTASYSVTSSTASTFNITQLTTGRRVVSIAVNVTTAFDGTPLLQLGYKIDSANSSVASLNGLMTVDMNNLNELGTYVTDTAVKFGIGGSTGVNIDGDVTLTGSFSSGLSTVGEAIIIITYV